MLKTAFVALGIEKPLATGGLGGTEKLGNAKPGFVKEITDLDMAVKRGAVKTGM